MGVEVCSRVFTLGAREDLAWDLGSMKWLRLRTPTLCFLLPPHSGPGIQPS